MDTDRGPREIARAEAYVTAAQLAELVPARVKRGRRKGLASQSRRDGFRPRGEWHVWTYLEVEALGASPEAIAVALGRHRATIYRSIAIGRAMVAQRRARCG